MISVFKSVKIQSRKPMEELEMKGKAAVERGKGLTVKAFILSMLASVIIAFWTQHSELVIDSPSFNSIHPSIAGFFAVICISLFINPLLRAIGERWALNQREMLTIYSILIVVGPIVSIGGVHFFLPTLIAPYYYATPENEYAELFHDYIPSWFGPKDPEVIRTFYEGSEGMGVPWEAWIKPLAIWTPFLMAVYFAFICLNVIVRRQWVESEKLTFPLVQLPLEMTRDPERGELFNRFFKNGLMWVGFAIPVVLHGINGTHNYFPSFPFIRYKHISISRYFTDRPWSAMGHTELSFYPCIIGFSYLLTVDVSFSVGFFYLLSKAQLILGDVLGWGRRGSAMSQYYLIEYQGAGAFLAIAISCLIVARKHLLRILRKAFLGSEEVDDSSEPLPYRWAVIGYLLSIGFLTFWSVTAGMSLWAALTFFILFSLFALSLTRMRVQAGLGCVHGPMPIQELMVRGVGAVRLGPANLTILSHYFFMTGEMRGVMSVMPSQLEGFRLAQYTDIDPRRLVLGIVLGSIIGLLLAYFASLRTIYKYGANILNRWRVRSMPTIPFVQLRSWLIDPPEVDWVGLQFVALGAAFTAFLSFMRLRFIWWPFHPIGYAAAFTGRTIHWVWFPMLLGCLFKYLALKQGGARGYRRFQPFFLGLILGDFFMGGFWGLVGLSSDHPGYLLFP